MIYCQRDLLLRAKKRLQVLRGIWRNYKNAPNWKKLIKEITQFVSDKLVYEKEGLEKIAEFGSSGNDGK